MHRVMVTDGVSEAGVQLLTETEGIETVVVPTIKDVQELRAKLAEFDGVIIRSATKLTAEILEGQSRLRVIVRAGVGVDNIDRDAATKEGILVMNTPEGNTTSTAEQTVALMLGLARNIGPADASMKAGRWDRKQFTGTQLAGKTLAVVGLGRIGATVIAIAKAMGMKVIGYDPFATTERAESLGITLLREFDEVIAEGDVFTFHTPLTDSTRDLIDAKALQAMKPTALLINCARGGIINEEDLLEALNNDEIGGAALDVYMKENPTEGTSKALAEHPKVLATPHLGASTKEAQVQVAVEAAEIISVYLLNEEIRHAVNMAPVTGSEMSELERYLDLAYRLGKLLAGQAGSKGLKRAEIVYRGEIADKKTKLLTSSFAIGLLEQGLDANINMINAIVMAEQRGLPIQESSSHGRTDFSSSIDVTLETDSGELTAAGTVFGTDYLRLIRLNGFHMDAFLDGNLLIYRHIDRPGQIGRIGQILGKHGVNIANMSLGRLSNKSGGDSIAVLHLDELPSEEALAEIGDHEDVTGVDLVSLPAARRFVTSE